MTFVILALFWRDSDESVEAPDYTILHSTVPDLVVASFQLLTVLALALLVVAGLFGNPGTFKNITPVAVWVIWWVGFGFLAAFIGNIWPLINPWTSVFGFAENDSASARELVSDLFRRQAKAPKITRGEALRQAMLALIDSDGFKDETGRILFSYAHPLFWARTASSATAAHSEQMPPGYLPSRLM